MKKSQKIAISAMLYAVGIVLPFFTGQIQVIGQMLCPMHIPVFLCGLIVGWKYGLVIGFLLPFTRSVLFGMPPLFPMAVSMAFELATYGFVSGFLYEHSRWQCVKALYRCMIPAMILGRLVWGIVSFILYGISGSAFTWSMFLSGALLTAIPGIILQLILIPVIMVALNRARLVPFKRIETTEAERA